MNAHPLAGMFPTLSDGDLRSLADDIGANGLLEPITVLGGEILDGRNRFAACQLADVEARTVEFTGTDPLAFVISMNLRRRHLSTSQRALIAAEMSGEQQQGKRNDLGQSAQVTREEASALLNVGERTVKRAAALIEQDPVLAEAIKNGAADESVDGGLKRAKRAKREQAARAATVEREQEAVASIAAAPELPYHLHHGSLKTWRPENVASIITDPPYVGDSIPLYRLLRDFALDTLPDGGPLVVMTWQAILPQVIAALDHPYLAYRWTICWRYANAENTVDHARRVFDCWKPVLVYHKGSMPKDAPMLRDEIANKAGDKDFHEWGQSVDGFERLVKTFSQPGEIVCDPFLGGGTTAVAALALSRRFTGCDIDDSAVTTTKRRLGVAA